MATNSLGNNNNVVIGDEEDYDDDGNLMSIDLPTGPPLMTTEDEQDQDYIEQMRAQVKKSREEQKTFDAEQFMLESQRAQRSYLARNQPYVHYITCLSILLFA